MPHFYERNIVEIKNEYTTFLVTMITPPIYEGMKSIYDYSALFKKHNKTYKPNLTILHAD